MDFESAVTELNGNTDDASHISEDKDEEPATAEGKLSMEKCIKLTRKIICALEKQDFNFEIGILHLSKI